MNRREFPSPAPGPALALAPASGRLWPDPECGLVGAGGGQAVVERPGMGLEIVAAPGSPAGELARGFHVQVGASEKCGFAEVIHLDWAFI